MPVGWKISISCRSPLPDGQASASGAKGAIVINPSICSRSSASSPSSGRARPVFQRRRGARGRQSAAGAAGTPRAAGWNTYAAHLLTPETRTRTHYFFAAILPAAEARQHVDDSQLREVLTNIFAGEDSPMLAAVQQRMGDRELWSMKPVTLPGDEGAVAVRRALALLIDAQPR